MAEEVRGNLRGYDRVEPPAWPPSLPEDPGAIASAIRNDRSSDWAQLYGRFRHDVTQAESESAGRLAAVLYAVRTFLAAGTVPERAKAEECVRFMIARHGVRALPADAENDRQWVIEVSRRYDVLPPAWRVL